MRQELYTIYRLPARGNPTAKVPQGTAHKDIEVLVGIREFVAFEYL